MGRWNFCHTPLRSTGYSILFIASYFWRPLAFPVPAALGLLIAGGAAAQGRLCAGNVCDACALGAMLLGDSIMYLLGKLTGWWLLSLLCRISMNPEAVHPAVDTDRFHKRGRALLLVVAKFLPGHQYDGCRSPAVWACRSFGVRRARFHRWRLYSGRLVRLRLSLQRFSTSGSHGAIPLSATS